MVSKSERRKPPCSNGFAGSVPIPASVFWQVPVIGSCEGRGDTPDDQRVRS